MKLQRMWIARILLFVFVPMLLMSSLHVHESSSSRSVVCVECLHHIHHSGHFSVEHSGIDNCVLCQFQSLPYVAALLIALSFIVRKSFLHPDVAETIPGLEIFGIYLGRAPPCDL